MPVEAGGKIYATNSDGFLINADEWTPEVGCAFAEIHGIVLTGPHWEIINLLRSHCLEQGAEPPSMRGLSSAIKSSLEPEKSRSIYLMKLFGSSPAKMVAQIAGLPKPKNCL